MGYRVVVVPAEGQEVDEWRMVPRALEFWLHLSWCASCCARACTAASSRTTCPAARMRAMSAGVCSRSASLHVMSLSGAVVQTLSSGKRSDGEFVQCLASPLYLEYLAQHNYLENDKFMAFLRYLKYFERPEYVRFVEYPDCLGFLELLLTSKKFRDDVRGAGCRDWVHQQQFEAWRTAHARAHVTPDLLKPLRDAQLPARPVTQADLEATVDAPA